MHPGKSLTRPGRKEANVSVRMSWITFGALPCRKEKHLMTARVSMLLKSRASLTCFRACFLLGRAKDLSAPRYNSSLRYRHVRIQHSNHAELAVAKVFRCEMRTNVPPSSISLLLIIATVSTKTEYHVSYATDNFQHPRHLILPLFRIRYAHVSVPGL